MTRSWFRYAALRSGVAGCRAHPATSSNCRFFTMSGSLGPSGSRRSAWTTATPVKDRGTATRRCCLRPPLRASVSPWRVHRSSQRTWNPAGWFGFFPGACPRDTRTSSCILRGPKTSEKSKCSRSGCSSRSGLSNERTPSSLKPGRTHCLCPRRPRDHLSRGALPRNQQRARPPLKLVEHGLRVQLEVRKFLQVLALLQGRHEIGALEMDSGTRRSHLQLHAHEPQLLDRPGRPD